MNDKRKLPTLEEAAEMLKRGILDDSILYLSDEELREALADYRRAGPEVGEPDGSTGDDPQPRRERRSIA